MTTEERLERLENELARVKHRNRWLLAVVGLVVGAFVLVWIVTGTQGGSAASIVQARGFVVVDENDQTRVELGPGRLFLFGKNNKGFISLAADYGPTLNMFDENGKPRARLNVDEDGMGLHLLDENGKVRACFGAGTTVSPDGTKTTYPESSLLLFGPDGKAIWQAP